MIRPELETNKVIHSPEWHIEFSKFSIDSHLWFLYEKIMELWEKEAVVYDSDLKASVHIPNPERLQLEKEMSIYADLTYPVMMMVKKEIRA